MPTLFESRLNLSNEEIKAQSDALETGEDLVDPGDEDDEPTQPGDMPESISEEETEASTDEEEEVDPLFEIPAEEKTEEPTEEKSYISLKDEDKSALAQTVKQEILTSLGISSMEELQTTLGFVRQLAQRQVADTLTQSIIEFGVMQDAAPQVLEQVMDYWSKLTPEQTQAIAQKEAEKGLSPVKQILTVLRKTGKLPTTVLASSGKPSVKTKPLNPSQRSTNAGLSEDDLLKMSDEDYAATVDAMFA